MSAGVHRDRPPADDRGDRSLRVRENRGKSIDLDLARGLQYPEARRRRCLHSTRDGNGTLVAGEISRRVAAGVIRGGGPGHYPYLDASRR